MIKKLLSTLIAFLIVLIAQSQGVVGEWKDYLSFAKSFDLVRSGEKVYCASEGGLFYYNTSDNSINKISRLNGLSDFGIKTIAYHSEKELLVVAYKNSNIDLIYNNRVVNLSDIKRKSLSGDKSINNILFIGNEAYLSCGFGIVVINLDKQEVKDTYLIGAEGAQINVFDLKLDNNILYAATEDGLFSAEIDDPNLLDYRSWSHVENIPHASGQFKTLDFFSGKLIANYSNGSSSNESNELYQKTGNSWERILNNISNVRDLQSDGNYLTITSSNDIFVYDQNLQLQINVNNYPGIEISKWEINPQSAHYSESTGLWIADYKFGLIKAGLTNYESIFPEGPIDNKAFNLYTNENDFWVISGGLDDAWDNTWAAPQFQLMRDQSWDYFTKKEYPEMNGLNDIICMVADPSDQNHIYVGLWGGGLLEFQNGQFQNRFTQHNSKLETSVPAQPNEPHVRIGGMDFDSKGNLWISNSDVSNMLSVKYTDGEWESINLPNAMQKKIGKLIVTENNDKWIIIPRGNNLYVVNEDATQKEYLPVKSYFNNGETELITDMNDIYSIAEDLDGEIWVGTSKGVAVYFNPKQIWEPGSLYATHPGLELNDGLYHPLLETETITAIAVNGANQKWMGTVNSGIYLISENGEEEIYHFTEENSPLLSNTITSIAINNKSGEVFIGTKKGIISYQGEATEGHNDFENVLVYPNPVRETYNGPITISGLVSESDLKITDISGNLVYKTTSLGGQATWDGNNLNGNRVKTGVYLIFLTDKTGEKTHISKLLFIN